jgi:hypothetical protein
MTISELRIVWIHLSFFKVVEVSVRGKTMEHLDTPFEPLPAGEYRLQIGVVRVPESSTASNWDLDILYEHSPAFAKRRLMAEITIHGRDKARIVVQNVEHSHHFNIIFLATFLSNVPFLCQADVCEPDSQLHRAHRFCGLCDAPKTALCHCDVGCCLGSTD